MTSSLFSWDSVFLIPMLIKCFAASGGQRGGRGAAVFALVKEENPRLSRCGISQVVYGEHEDIPGLLDAIFEGERSILTMTEPLTGEYCELSLGHVTVRVEGTGVKHKEDIRKILFNALEPSPSPSVLPTAPQRMSGPKKNFIRGLELLRKQDAEAFSATIRGLSLVPDVLFSVLLPHLVNVEDSKDELYPTLMGVIECFDARKFPQLRKKLVEFIEVMSREQQLSYSARRSLVNAMANGLRTHPARQWPPLTTVVGDMEVFVFPLTEIQVSQLRSEPDWKTRTIRPYVLERTGEVEEILDLIRTSLGNDQWRLPTPSEWLGIAGLDHDECPPWPWGSEPPRLRQHAHFIYSRTGGSINEHVVEVGVFPAGNSTTGLVDLIGNAYELTKDEAGERKLAGGAFTTKYSTEESFSVISKFVDVTNIDTRRNVCLRLVVPARD